MDWVALEATIFLILPEEDPSKNFMAGLMIQQLSRELFAVADENGGKLQNRVVFFCDELGTMPPFDILPLFSAGRSRKLTLVPIIQSLAQLEKNYGKEGAEIIPPFSSATANNSRDSCWIMSPAIRFLLGSSSGRIRKIADFFLAKLSAFMLGSKQRICSSSESRNEFNLDSTVDRTDAIACSYVFSAAPANPAKAEKYAKILAKTIISPDGDSSNRGQNAFFYDAAEGLLTSVILLLAEFLPPKEIDGKMQERRHIVSVFKLVQDLLEPASGANKGKSQFQVLMSKLPSEHKARWFAGAALNT